MTIIRNSAQCSYCGEEIESRHRHDFKVHVCRLHFVPALEWYKDKDGHHKIREKVPREQAFNFAVDGGHAYIRRVGTGFTDTSVSDDL